MADLLKGRWGLFGGATALALALAARTLVFGLVTVRTGSMEPAVSEGSTVWFSRLASPEPGDIVAVRLPDDPELLHIKRVVAVGPCEVELVDGRLYVDGSRIYGDSRELQWKDAECQLKQVAGIEERGVLLEKAGSQERIRLNADEVFLLGDRRAKSEDSRQWGPVRQELVQGVVGGVAWGRPSCDP